MLDFYFLIFSYLISNQTKKNNIKVFFKNFYFFKSFFLLKSLNKHFFIFQNLIFLSNVVSHQSVNLFSINILNQLYFLKFSSRKVKNTITLFISNFLEKNLDNIAGEEKKQLKKNKIISKITKKLKINKYKYIFSKNTNTQQSHQYYMYYFYTSYFNN